MERILNLAGESHQEPEPVACVANVFAVQLVRLLFVKVCFRIRYAKGVWTWSWAACSRCPCLSRGVGADDLQGFWKAFVFIVML